MPVKLLSSANFEKNVRRLVRHYPHLTDDLDVLLAQLLKGQTPGDRISGVGYTAYKVRLKSSDINRGENASFRVIYYLKTKECVYLVTIYSKSKQTDIEKKALKQMIDDILGNKDLVC